MKVLRKIEREFYRIKAQIFLPKEKRAAWLNEKIETLYSKEKHIFGISYSVFDGFELLEKSIQSLRSVVDYVNVVYQDVSWTGKQGDDNLLGVLQDLKTRGLIDEILKFEPDLTATAVENEKRKRNIGLEAAKKFGCDYFMTMDCDEFYLEDEVREAKQFIVKRGITHAYCPFVNYGLSPMTRLVEPAPAAVQFFCKINRFSHLGRGRRGKRIAIVDGTRVMSDRLFGKYFMVQCVKMHHMTYIRKNLTKKFVCSSWGGSMPPSTKEEIAAIISKAEKSLSVAVPNVFDIRI